MNINIKYNVGDKVWYFKEELIPVDSPPKIKKGIVESILLLIDKDTSSLSYSLEKSQRVFNECDLFTTKDELLKSLKNEKSGLRQI